MMYGMNVALRQAGMTREQFFDWADAQDERYEFDGVGPVLMTDGTNNHSVINQNLYFALRSRLQGSGWLVLGPDTGLETVGNTVRYPDGMVTRAKYLGTDRVVPGVVVVFEVLSPTSGRMDRIIKLREYRAISTILRYVILESASAGATAFSREDGAADWTAVPLLVEDTLDLPELSVFIPVSELYIDVDLPGNDEDTAATV